MSELCPFLFLAVLVTTQQAAGLPCPRSPSFASVGCRTEVSWNHHTSRCSLARESSCSFRLFAGSPLSWACGQLYGMAWLSAVYKFFLDSECATRWSILDFWCPLVVNAAFAFSLCRSPEALPCRGQNFQSISFCERVLLLLRRGGDLAAAAALCRTVGALPLEYERFQWGTSERQRTAAAATYFIQFVVTYMRQTISSLHFYAS